MIPFLLGCLVGGTVGLLTAAFCRAAADGDRTTPPAMRITGPESIPGWRAIEARGGLVRSAVVIQCVAEAAP